MFLIQTIVHIKHLALYQVITHSTFSEGILSFSKELKERSKARLSESGRAS